MRPVPITGTPLRSGGSNMHICGEEIQWFLQMFTFVAQAADIRGMTLLGLKNRWRALTSKRPKAGSCNCSQHGEQTGDGSNP